MKFTTLLGLQSQTTRLFEKNGSQGKGGADEKKKKKKAKKRETLLFFFLFPFSPLPHQISLRRPEHKLHRKKGGDESCYGIVTLHDAFFQKDLYS